MGWPIQLTEKVLIIEHLSKNAVSLPSSSADYKLN